MNARIMNSRPTRNLLLQGVCHLALAAAMCGVLGCSKRYHDVPAYWPVPLSEYENQGVGRFKSAYMAEQIDNYYRGSNPGPIGVTTFVNLDDLYTTSSFGRMYAEQLMSELAIRGYDVIELRHSDAVQFLFHSGELALSRDPGAIRRERELGGIVVGTYVASPVRVYVNARMVDPSSSMVLSAASVEMDKTRELARMLRNGSVPGTLERIPVRHLAYGESPLALPSMHQRWVDPLEAGSPPPLWRPPGQPVEPRLPDAPPVSSKQRLAK